MEPKILNHLALLGLNEGASWREVKHAYRDEIRRCHPDLFIENNKHSHFAEARAKELNQAYHELKSHFAHCTRVKISSDKTTTTQEQEEVVSPAAQRREKVLWNDGFHSKRKEVGGFCYGLSLFTDVVCETCALIFSPLALGAFLTVGAFTGYPSATVFKQAAVDIYDQVHKTIELPVVLLNEFKKR